MWKYYFRLCNLSGLDILIEKNRFERNIGGFSSTAGCVSVSCYLNATHSDNSEEGKIIGRYNGFMEGVEEDIYNYLIDREQYKENMLRN